MTSDQETRFTLATAILVFFDPCVHDVIHLAGGALGVGEEPGDEFDGDTFEDTFTEDTVVIHARVDGSAEEAFAWIHEDPTTHAFTRYQRGI